MATNSISLITICYNNLEDLKKTCASVDAQYLPPFEHVIIDGSTNAEVVNFLVDHPQPPYRRWLSEPDQGISDAFNKGIRLASGDWIGILNSGDEFFGKEVMDHLGTTLLPDTGHSWIHAKQLTYRGGHWVAVGKPFEKAKLYKGMRGVFHSTMYLKTELYRNYGGYDLECKYSMDFDLLCRIRNEPCLFLDETLVKFNPYGRSSLNYEKAQWEIYRIYQKHFGFSIKQWAWTCRLILINRLLSTGIGKFLYRIKILLKLENK